MITFDIFDLLRYNYDQLCFLSSNYVFKWNRRKYLYKLGEFPKIFESNYYVNILSYVNEEWYPFELTTNEEYVDILLCRRQHWYPNATTLFGFT